MKPSDITAVDFFCGCGGSTTGAVEAGVRVTHAVNHEQIAIASHNTNYPDTDHDCVDVTQIPANRYPEATLGLFSPECGGHGTAAGKKRVVGQLSLFEQEQADIGRERSRMTMMEVCRFTEALNFQYVIVENVPEVTRWYLFDQWLYELTKLGYKHKIVSFNSQFAYPIPQSRDRVYIHFWRKGNRAPNLEYKPTGFCATCNKSVSTYQHWKNQRITVGRYRQQYVYRCDRCFNVVEPDVASAASIVNWDLVCPKIGDRIQPLRTATLKRIEIGLQKYGIPFLAELYGTGTARSLEKPIGTITTSGAHHALVAHPSFLVQYNGKSHASSLSEPLPTITTVDRCGLVDAHFLLQYYGRESAASSTTKPLPTITTENRHALIQCAHEVLECGFRMLQPAELKLGMGFQESYVVLGNKKQQVKQVGNAVTPGALKWQIERAIESL
jgi:DNA (cytosine-5)-methyltransferase 1